MVSSQFVANVRRTALTKSYRECSDAELLGRYLDHREESAFESIVQRHGAQVFGMCRRVLGHTQDAEDAFQATFIVLIRRAANIAPRDRLAAWLHGVAHRTALKARTTKLRQISRDLRATPADMTLPADPPEVLPLLDRELAALPEIYRSAIVLCDLEGKSRTEAATQLGWREGTLSGRLARGRKLLANRLQRRGFVPALGLGAYLSQQVWAVSPRPELSVSAVQSALLSAAGLSAGSNPAAMLAQEVLRSMNTSLRKFVMGTCLVALFTGFLAHLLFAQTPPPQPILDAVPPILVGQVGKDVELEGKLILHRGRKLSVVEGKKDPTDQTIIEGEGKFNYQPDMARLSPDGRWLVVGVAEPGRPPSTLRLRDLTKMAEPEVVVNMAGSELSNYVWSPDGKQIAFNVWDEAAKQYQTYLFDMANKTTEKATMPEIPGQGPKGFGVNIHAWSNDGLWLTHEKGRFHLVNPKSRTARTLTNVNVGFRTGTCRFSPDGKKIVFVQNLGNKQAKLAVIDVLMGDLTAVADLNDTVRYLPDWSPDSRRIAYSYVDYEAKKSGINVLDPTTGQTRTVIADDDGAVELNLTAWRPSAK